MVFFTIGLNFNYLLVSKRVTEVLCDFSCGKIISNISEFLKLYRNIRENNGKILTF